jgi:hypothetical protein
MFITLTNCSPAFRGQKIAIKKDLIVTINRNDAIVREDGTIEAVTFIFVPPHGTWEVTETLEEIMDLLK